MHQNKEDWGVCKQAEATKNSNPAQFIFINDHICCWVSTSRYTVYIYIQTLYGGQMLEEHKQVHKIKDFANRKGRKNDLFEIDYFSCKQSLFSWNKLILVFELSSTLQQVEIRLQSHKSTIEKPFLPILHFCIYQVQNPNARSLRFDIGTYPTKRILQKL